MSDPATAETPKGDRDRLQTPRNKAGADRTERLGEAELGAEIKMGSWLRGGSVSRKSTVSWS